MSKIKTFGSHLVDFDLIPPNGIFIDAGACEGNFIKEVKAHSKSPFILAIEPNKKNARELIHEKYDQVIVLEAALVGSNEPKKMPFNDFNACGLPEWGNVTGLYENRPHTTYEVETMDIAELLGIVPSLIIHHLKMDIEGCEHGVIKDLTLEMAERIQQISMEVHSGLQFMELDLKKLGYDTQFDKGELYAVRKEL